MTLSRRFLNSPHFSPFLRIYFRFSTNICWLLILACYCLSEAVCYRFSNLPSSLFLWCSAKLIFFRTRVVLSSKVERTFCCTSFIILISFSLLIISSSASSNAYVVAFNDPVSFALMFKISLNSVLLIFMSFTDYLILRVPLSAGNLM